LNNCRSVFDEDHLWLYRADIINSSFAPEFAKGNRRGRSVLFTLLRRRNLI